MGRKGISFTLTIVVVGVILLMTSLSIITLGGSSLSEFFSVLSSKQGTTAQCNDVAKKAQTYCEKKIVSEAEVTWTESSGDLYYNSTDSYSWGSTTYDCSDTESGTVLTGPSIDASKSDPAQNVFYDLSSASIGDSHPASSGGNSSTVTASVGYERSASENNCDWTEHSPVDNTVTVDGDEIDCIEEGYVNGPSCPAQ